MTAGHCPRMLMDAKMFPVQASAGSASIARHTAPAGPACLNNTHCSGGGDLRLIRAVRP